MQYDISYLTIFFPNHWGYIHIHANTDIYIRYTYKYGNDTDKYMQILPWHPGPGSPAAPSILEGLWYPRPAARGPHAAVGSGGGGGVGVTVNGDRRVTVIMTRMPRGPTARLWHRSARQWSTDCRAAGGQCRSYGRNLPGGPATVRNQTRTSAGSRPRRAAAARPTQAGRVQVSGLGHSRWVTSDTRITQIKCDDPFAESSRPATAGPRDTWQQENRRRDAHVDRSRCSRSASSFSIISLLNPLYVLFLDVFCARNNFITINVNLSAMLLVSTLVMNVFSLLQTYVFFWGKKTLLLKYLTLSGQNFPRQSKLWQSFKYLWQLCLSSPFFASSVEVRLSGCLGCSFFHNMQYFDVV